MNAKYDKLDNEIRYKRLLKNKQSVIVEHTNYSTQYKIGKWSYLDTSEDLPTDISVPILKVDLNEAYWRKAIQLGIISQETEQAFLDHKFETKKDRKYCRLKALGALATIKRVKAYKYGLPDLIYVDKNGIKTNEKLKVNMPLRELYMAICEQVSNDMKHLMVNIEGCMYQPVQK